MEEIFDIYTRDGKYTGKELKSVCHSKNAIFYHKHDRIYYDNLAKYVSELEKTEEFKKYTYKEL